VSALGVIATCLAGVFVYGFGWAFVFLRLLWRFKQSEVRSSLYDSGHAGEHAFFAATFLPIGLGLVALYALTVEAHEGLPPRRVRQAQLEKQQADEVERLQHEIDTLKYTAAR
jgi:hypothetical protein